MTLTSCTRSHITTSKQNDFISNMRKNDHLKPRKLYPLAIQQELFRYCLDSKHVLLMGDFNSRVKNLPDFVQIDKYMCDVYGLHDLYEENTNILNILEVNNISLNRHSADNTVNSYGYNLLEFCKNNNIFILNGRFENDLSQPSLTCKNSSTVDYFLSTANVMPNVDTSTGTFCFKHR